MDDALFQNQLIAGDLSVSGNTQYLQWIENVKNRYRQSQIKAHLQVNAAVLEFNWNLGHDISEILRTRNSRNHKVSRRIICIGWPGFTDSIRNRKKLWHKSCNDCNHLK